MQRTRIIDGAFDAHAKALRTHFDQRFADPRKARGDRFVWDYWHVPGQYTALRTPAWEYFPKSPYERWHRQLVAWGREHLGCHDISPPWLSVYVEGCRQELHGDLPHGPFAFVFSLTHWAERSFRGGETLLVRDGILDHWSEAAHDEQQQGLEEGGILETVEPTFGRLLVFDPRIPHGSSLWEQAIVQTVGADKPGHVLVAAAGNSGAAPVLPIHQSVHVVKDTRTLVPIDSGDEGGSVSVWINFRNATGMRVGLIGPGGDEWIAPQADGQAAGHNVGSGASQYNAAVVHGGSAPNSPIASGSQAAVVGWQGNWPKGTYRIVLEGEGSAELYLQAVSAVHGNQAAFLGGIREGTINLPADHPTLLAVGATVNRPGWTSKGGQDIRVRAPTFDAAGDVALDDAADLGEGDVAFFSSAGPNALGVPKPEIAAPGAVVASVLSGQARPDTALSIFSGTRCPPDRRTGLVDPLCMLVDDQHAVTSGTSMAAPVVAGAVALLLQRDPTLTQGEAVALIQAGAHPHRGLAPYAAQSGPGELDAVGSLAALARMHDPKLALPSSAASWISLGGDYWDASGGTEMQALLELRNERGEPADLFDASRLQADVRIGDEPQASPPIERLAPGLYRYRALAPAGRGGQLASFGARFDGQPVVQVKTIPIGLDGWRSRYPTTLGGGCTLHEAGAPASLLPGLAVAALLLVRRRQRSSAKVTTAPCGSKLI